MRGTKESNLSGSPNEISYECTKKILEQMEKNICIIKIDNIQGTGFFTKIPFPDLNNMLPVLITNNHIINEELLNANDEKIIIRIKQDNFFKTLNLNNRIKYSREDYDITIIEIKDEDEIINYLDLDDIIIDDILKNNNANVEYIDKTIYIIHYPKSELSVSYGVLSNIDELKKFDLIHSCSTEPGSSGSPIFNLKNKVLGYHKDGLSSNNNNLGAFLNYPLKEFIKFKSKIIQNNDEVKTYYKRDLILSSKMAKTSKKKKEKLFIDYKNTSIKKLNIISKKDDSEQICNTRNTLNYSSSPSQNFITKRNKVKNNMLKKHKKNLRLEGNILKSSQNKHQDISNKNITVQNELEHLKLEQLDPIIKQSLININIQPSKKNDINNKFRDNLLINNNLEVF